MSSTATTIEHAVPPKAGPRAFVRRLRNGDEIAHLVTLVFAASILLHHLRARLRALGQFPAVAAAIRLGIFRESDLGPDLGQFRRGAFYLRHSRHRGCFPRDRGPAGTGAAIFLAELAPRKLSDSIAFLIDLLAAVPSVIYGLLGIFIVVPLMRTTVGPLLKHTLGNVPLIGKFFKGPNYGVGFLTAGMVLAIMIVPFIISVSREVLLTVPREQREAALGLGATRWEATWKVVVPWARTGIMGSVFLALARALGETMAVTMVIGNDPRIAASLFAPGYSIAAVIANEFTEATGDLYLAR